MLLIFSSFKNINFTFHRFQRWFECAVVVWSFIHISWSKQMLYLLSVVSNTHVPMATAVLGGGKGTHERDQHTNFRKLSSQVVLPCQHISCIWVLEIYHVQLFFILQFQCNSILIFRSIGYGSSTSLAYKEKPPLPATYLNLHVHLPIHIIRIIA